ncbi:acyl-CoA carboxylase subunit epsilon [Curtobacterium sp. RRHDQ10]|uniref:acyl-CoA carboxylase subunit epsilon n=1 Tax=Curtobacterium phyllosphaerae TaxID=3413379 RepID=UPI003BF189B9
MSRHASDGPVDGDRPGGSTDSARTAPGMRVVAGTPTPEELAAVTAVLRAAADEAERVGRTRVDGAPRSAWDASARGLRTPLERGAWSRSLG